MSAEAQQRVEQQLPARIATMDVSTETAPWSLIDKDLRLLPEFTIEKVMDYFLYQKESDGLARQDWKSFNSKGFKLFREGHVQKIYASISTKFNRVNVKATCLPEMKKDRAYSLLMALDRATANVCSAQCSCPAGKGPCGSCKHLAALCFALEDFVKMRSVVLEKGEDACTSLMQKWNQPRKKRLESKKVEDIDFSSIPHGKEAPIRVHHHSYDPSPCEMQKTTKNELEEFTEQLKKALQVPCGFLHFLTNPSEETPKVHSLPLTPRSIQNTSQNISE